MPITKVTCTDYDEPNDEFTFKIERAGFADETVKKNGLEITELGDMPIVQMSDSSVAIYCLYSRNFKEVPQDLLNQSFEL